MVSESITSGWVGEEPGGGQGSPQRNSGNWERRPRLRSVLAPLPSTPALGESEAPGPSAPLPLSSCGPFRFLEQLFCSFYLSSCLPFILTLFLSSASHFLCSSPPERFRLAVPSGAAIANGAVYLLFPKHLLAVNSWLLGWFLQPWSVYGHSCLAVESEPGPGESWVLCEPGLAGCLYLTSLITSVFNCICKPPRKRNLVLSIYLTCLYFALLTEQG